MLEANKKYKLEELKAILEEAGDKVIAEMGNINKKDSKELNFVDFIIKMHTLLTVEEMKKALLIKEEK